MLIYTKKILTEIVFEQAQVLDLLDKDFKSAVANMFKKLKKKKKSSKQLKESMRRVSHHIENINKETEIIKRSKMETCSLVPLRQC